MTAFFIWLLLALGVASVLGVIGLVLAGAWVELIPWADRAIFTAIGITCSAGLSLFVLGALGRNELSAWLGMVLGVSWAVSGIVVLAPMAFFVARTRRRRGWTVSIAGKPPVAL